MEYKMQFKRNTSVLLGREKTEASIISTVAQMKSKIEELTQENDDLKKQLKRRNSLLQTLQECCLSLRNENLKLRGF